MSCCLPSCFWPRNWRLWQFCQRNGAGKKLNDCTDEEPLKRSDMATDSGNDATEIFPYLYLGGLGNRNTKFLTERKITAIINASNMNPKKITGCSQPYDIDELVIQIGDADICSIYQYFEEAGKMIDEAEKSKGTILVHCAAGISRSTTLVLAYLMKYKNMCLKDAHDWVKSKRKVVKPNPGFWSQLIEFEIKLFGKSSVQMVQENQECIEVNENSRLIPDVYKIETKTGMV